MIASLPLPLSLSSTSAERRRAWWLLVAMHVPIVGFCVAQAGLGLATSRASGNSAIALALVVAAGAIQLRHTFAAAAGVRPRHWQWTLLLLVAIAYSGLPVFAARWVTLQWFVLASFAMLLRGRLAVVVIAVSAIAHGIWYVGYETGLATPPFSGGALSTWSFVDWVALQFLGAGGLYGATRLVRLLDELRVARGDLAELAIDRERLRISRDLHDLLGQSLSAVSLKGDLAIGLLERGERPRASAEIEGLVSVARSALHDVLDVAHHEPPIALSSEIERAADLLASIGTEARVSIAGPSLSPPVDELFAWAVREGVTNVLRHSSATTCSITIARQNGTVRLEIINDGAMPASHSGNGLSGLAGRAAVLSGAASGNSSGDGLYRLTVEVPEMAR
jgi:two-component system sensor histidine kinase DesK